MTTPSETWDSSYATSTSPPWDIGRPQPVFVRLADAGLLSGRLLDAGCGTGEQTLLAASKGANALGIDISPRAIQLARDKAAERGIAAHFEVADALNLWQFGLTFDTVIDSGVFHIFDDEDRARYVASLASVLAPGGSLYLICFSEHQPGTLGPRRVRQDELRAAFSAGWNVTGILPEKFEINPESGFGTAAVEAWLATIRRLLRSRRRGEPGPVASAG
jgi:cyclopropane fatty-acyl-phospholipid synthase-like methyltransferase